MACVAVTSTLAGVTPDPDRQATPRRSAASAALCSSAERETPGPAAVRLTEMATMAGLALGLAPGESAAADAVAEPEKAGP